MKIFKSMGVAALIIGSFILFIGAIIWCSISWDRYRKTKEAIRYQKEVCDTIKTVEDNFQIIVSGFNKKELSKIHFYQQGKLLVSDTVINFVAKDDGETQTLKFPFKKFNVADKLVVNIGDRYYVLSGYRYHARYNYGMLGPVDPCFCDPKGFEKISGAPHGSGWLIKKYGLVDYQLPPRQ